MRVIAEKVSSKVFMVQLDDLGPWESEGIIVNVRTGQVHRKGLVQGMLKFGYWYPVTNHDLAEKALRIVKVKYGDQE